MPRIQRLYQIRKDITYTTSSSRVPLRQQHAIWIHDALNWFTWVGCISKYNESECKIWLFILLYLTSHFEKKSTSRSASQAATMDENNSHVLSHSEILHGVLINDDQKNYHVQNIKLHECLTGNNMQPEYIMF